MWRLHGLVQIAVISCLMLMSLIQTTDGRICSPFIRTVSEASLCSEHRKQNYLPKVQKWSGPWHYHPLLQVSDDSSFSKSMVQVTDVAFSLNSFIKPSVTNQVWSCCGYIDNITQYISISKLNGLNFYNQLWNQVFSG